VPLEAWLAQAMSVPGLEVIPLTVPIIATAARLVVLRDPADMLIVATAQHHGARLVTSDARIEASKAVGVVG
jgi:PIN domain nuclease of toxin-antitoxin system